MTHATDTLTSDTLNISVADQSEVAVSVIVPVAERPDELAGLFREYAKPLRDSARSFEFLFVAEPWFRGMTEPLHELVSGGERVRVLQVAQAMGETALIRIGAARCRAPIVVTLPAYRRVEASALPQLIERVEQGVDVAVARRWPRRDSWINRFQNRVFHALLGRLTAGKIHDVACGVIALRGDVLQQLPLYGDFFRFLPLLALREGYRVEEVCAPQHERDTSTRLYHPGVYLRRMIDVLGLFFLLRFTDKPLRFFGLLGSVLVIAGGGVLLVLAVQRLGGQGIADRPLLLLGVLSVVLGAQAIALGLVGEIIVHQHASRRRRYRVEPPPLS